MKTEEIGFGSTKRIIKLKKFISGNEVYWMWKDGEEAMSPKFDTIQCALRYAGNVPFMSKREWEERPIPKDFPEELT